MILNVKSHTIGELKMAILQKETPDSFMASTKWKLSVIIGLVVVAAILAYLVL